jgi:hypothetical protein
MDIHGLSTDVDLKSRIRPKTKTLPVYLGGGPQTVNRRLPRRGGAPAWNKVPSTATIHLALTNLGGGYATGSGDIIGDITPIIGLRRPQGDEWSTEDWQAYFDERAAIAEFDVGLRRPEAEA